tara:strand:+ start:386 stop:955 length:570 start_codon:yes stop_codon:yes gene_type:complete
MPGQRAADAKVRIPSVPIRVRHRVLFVGGHGAHQERLALAMLGRSGTMVYHPDVRPATRGLRSATVVPSGWGSGRLEVIEAPALDWVMGRCNVDSHAYEMVASVVAEHASSTTVVFCVNGADNLHGVRPNQFLDALQASVRRTVRGVVAVTGCTLALSTLCDLALTGSRPIVMGALGADPGVILHAAGL